MENKVICIKKITQENFTCEIGEIYDYWSNFGGLNHFVSDGINHLVLSGPTDVKYNDSDDRPYIFDYFIYLSEHRDNIIRDILKN